MYDIVRIQEPLLTNIKKLEISPINIIDMFPMMKSGLSTKTSVLQLTTMFSSIDWIRENGLPEKWFDRRLLIDELRDKVLAEETIMKAIVKIRDILRKVGSFTTIYNIAIAMRGLKSNVDFNEHFTQENNDKIIEIFLQHPKIDPLHICATQIDVARTHKFLNDPRSNKLLVYRKTSVRDRKEIKQIIAADIILRIFLYEQYLSSLPKDIFNYLTRLEIF